MSATIRFVPDDVRWRGEAPVELLVAAAAAGILVERACGARASCGRCRVRVLKGASAAGEADVRVLGGAAAADGWRLGCTLTLEGDAAIQVPTAARALAHKAFGDEDLFAHGFEPLERGRGMYGVAVDVGSTTLAVALVEMATGRVAATASSLNPQVRYGADVVSRIAWAQEHTGGTAQLHAALVGALDALIARCADGAGVARDAVVACAFVGNPTMLHTLLDADVTPLGHAPFAGTILGPWRGTARDLDLQLPPSTPAYLVPALRGHVGADMVAAIVATGLDRAERPTLLVDLGTNSEAALACGGRVLCASTAAGPAFEGATVHHGMRAAAGAIEQVRIRGCGRVWVRVAGGGEPRGVCGSGLVDAVAELLAAGVLEPSGRMRGAAELDGIVPPLLAARVVEQERLGRAFVLAGTPGGEVLLTARDVRQLQLAKGSIAAGIALLIESAGIAADDLDAVLLAGAFGNYLRKESAQAIGLLPPVDPERVRFVGNAAGAGARMALVDRGARARIERVASTATGVELAGLPAYEAAFLAALDFPAPLPEPRRAVAS